MRKLLLRVLLTLALVFAQTGAQLHAYTHLQTDSSNLPSQHTTLCGACASFAPLLAAIGSADVHADFSLRDVDRSVSMAVAPIVGRAPSHAYRSRAPPILL